MLKKKDFTDFKLEFNGELHQVDANTLINSLFHVTALLQEINGELNKENSTYKKLDIKVNAFSEGSFIVNLELISSLSELLTDVMTHKNIATAGTIIGILAALIKLKMFLKGKKPKEVKTEGDEVKIIGDNNSDIKIDKRTFHIYNHNPNANEAINKNFENLERDESISGMTIASEKENIKIDIKREDFRELSCTNELLEEEKNIKIDKEAKLRIFKIVFDQNSKWQFYYNGNKIYADIKDENFYKKIDSGEQFAKGDLLVCELQINQVYDNMVNTFINKSHQINKVHLHQSRNEQTNLNLNLE